MNTLVDTPRPNGVGHNQPPEPIPTDPAQELRDRLARDHAALITRFHELEVGATQLPAKIETAEQAKKITDFIALQVRPQIKAAATAHKREKDDFWTLGRVVDRFFNDPSNQLLKALGKIQDDAARYLEAAREATRQAQEEAKRKAEEARRKAEEEEARHRAAVALYAPTNRTAAVEHQAQADAAAAAAAEAAKVIEAPPDKGQIRGDHGSTGYLRENWKPEVIDPFAVPMKYMMLNERAVQDDIDEAVKLSRHKGGRPLAEFIEEMKALGIRVYNSNTFIAKG